MAKRREVDAKAKAEENVEVLSSGWSVNPS